MVDESETLPLLQGDVASRSGRRATRRVLAAAAATLVALSALYYSATVPRAARPAAFPSKTNWTEVAIEKNREDEKRGAPLAGTSGLYGWTCKDCDALVVVRLPGREPILQGHVDGLEVDVPRHRAHEQGRMPPVRDLQPRVGRGESDSGRHRHVTDGRRVHGGPQSLRLDSTVRSPHAHHHQFT